jgi:hypothetical protein
MPDFLRVTFCVVLTVILGACASRRVPVPAAAISVPAPASYINLQAGWRLRAVTPILKSGGYQLSATGDSAVSGNTIALSAGKDFIGYETAYYAVRKGSGDGVLVEFSSAEATREGKTEPQLRPLVRLFQIPRRAKYVRLVYLRRVSQSDHDMGVVAAMRMDALDLLTKQLEASPADACKPGRQTFCAWVPAGIAVRPEMQKVANGIPAWVPAR